MNLMQWQKSAVHIEMLMPLDLNSCSLISKLFFHLFKIQSVSLHVMNITICWKLPIKNAKLLNSSKTVNMQF